jgi:DNA processing protein
MSNSKLIYAVWLNAIEGIGARRYHEICRRFGSPQEAFENATRRELMEIPLMGERTAESILENRNQKALDSIEKSLDRKDARIYLLEEEGYPGILREIADPPPVLYVKGSLSFEGLRMLAMVGTRHPTRYGRDVAYRLAQELGEQGITVVSGLARGIDACCHAGALAGGGTTIAVLGCGVDIAYPTENRRLYEQVQERGLVISDYHFGAKPIGAHFPARNRIISGLSRGTVVVESKAKGGSLITASYAVEQNRDVFAVPGNINQETAKGTNALIADGAKMVQGAHSILEEYPDWGGALQSKSTEKGPDLQQLEPDERRIVQLLLEGELPFDSLISQTGMTAGSLGAVLTILEIKGIIKQLPGRIYCIS